MFMDDKTDEEKQAYSKKWKESMAHLNSSNT